MLRLLGRAALVASGALAYAILVPSCREDAGEPECAPGFAACDGNSELCDVDLGRNPQNCGSCGHACPANANAAPGCKGGLCSNACNKGFDDCDGNKANGCETPVADDVNNCGACNKKCPDNTECSGGVCRAKCGDGVGDCDGSIANGCETVLASSTPNCGACDQPCDQGLTCVDSKCVTAPSCASLVGRNPPLPNGPYRIEGPSGNFDAYCLLDPGADGGGWTLAAKIDGTKLTFAYGGEAWTSVDPINGSSLALDLDEAKLDAFSKLTPDQARIGFREGSEQTRWLVVDAPAKIGAAKLTLQDAFTNGGLYATTVGRDAWLALMNGVTQPTGCNREGWNVKAGTNSVRVGVLFGPGPDCTGAASFLGIGSKNASVVAGSLDGATMRPAMTYILVR